MTIDIDALREQVGKLDCGDNSCMFGGAGKGRNSGMGTNGGCVCHEQLRNGRLLRALLPLCDEVERLQVESKSLGAEVRALKRENDEQQYHLGEFGMERGGLFTERDELKAELDGIMRDYQIESDENVRDIVERTTAAAVRLRGEKTALKAEVGRLQSHIDAAGDGTNLVALLDLYHERKCAAEVRVRELEGEVRDYYLGAMEPPGSYDLCWKDVGKCERPIGHGGQCARSALDRALARVRELEGALRQCREALRSIHAEGDGTCFDFRIRFVGRDEAVTAADKALEGGK